MQLYIFRVKIKINCESEIKSRYLALCKKNGRTKNNFNVSVVNEVYHRRRDKKESIIITLSYQFSRIGLRHSFCT